MPSEFYSQRDHSFILQGVPIQDFFEGDDVIAFEPQGDAVAVTRGLDRNRTSYGGKRPGKFTLRLKPTSPTIPFIQELIRNQENGSPLLLTAVMIDGAGNGIASTGCSVQDESFNTGGPTMQAKVYGILCEEYERFTSPVVS